MNYENNNEDLDSQFHEDYMKPYTKKFNQCPFTKKEVCPDGTKSHNCMDCTRKQDMSMTAEDWIIMGIMLVIGYAVFKTLIYLYA